MVAMFLVFWKEVFEKPGQVRCSEMATRGLEGLIRF
jgi:hypothetical protein